MKLLVNGYTRIIITFYASVKPHKYQRTSHLFIMAFKVGTKGCVYHVFHPPTGLHYYDAFSYRHAFAENVLWSLYFPKNPVIRHLIQVFGANSFVVTVRKNFPTRNDAIDWLKRFYKKVNPASRLDWIADARFPARRPLHTKKNRIYTSKKGRNNLHWGHKMNTTQKMRRSQGQQYSFKLHPLKPVVDSKGKEHKIPRDAPLPKGWRNGRNTRTWSKW